MPQSRPSAASKPSRFAVRADPRAKSAAAARAA